MKTLKDLVEAGDVAALVDWLEPQPPAQRRAHLKPARALFKEWDAIVQDGSSWRVRGHPQATAAWVVVYAADAEAASGRGGWGLAPDEVVGLTRRLRPPGMAAFVAAILPQRWPLAAALVEAELAPRPADRLWALGMMGLPGRGRDAAGALKQWETVLLRDVALLFAHEGDGEHSLSAYFGGVWAEQLRAWAEAGKLSRAGLLDLCLSALLQGFAAGRQTFFTALFDSLDPTPEERRERTAELGRLLASSAGATVGWALGHLRGALEAGEVPAQLLGSATQVRAAATAKAAVGWLGRRAALVPGDSEGASALAGALGHADAGVQEAAARQLMRSCGAGELPALIAPFREGVHPRVRALLDAVAPAAVPNAKFAVASAGSTVATVAPPPDPLAEGRRLAPLPALDDHALLTEIAAWVEAATDVDRGELLLAELVRRPRPGAEVAAHARALSRTWARRLREPWEPGTLLAVVALSWALGQAPPSDPSAGSLWSSQRLYRLRALEAAERLAGGQRVAWFSLPTHRGGHIERSVALARWQGREGVVLPADVALAWQRLSGPSVEPPEADDHELTEAWRYVLGGPAPGSLPAALWVAAAHARAPANPDRSIEARHPALRGQKWRTEVGSRELVPHDWGGGSVQMLLVARGECLITPAWFLRDGEEVEQAAAVVAARAYLADPEVESMGVVGAAEHDRAVSPAWGDAVNARSLHALVQSVASTEVDTRRPDVVMALIDRAEPLGSIGHEVLAAALLNAHAVVRLAGVDLLIAAASDGRLDAAQLAAGIVLLTQGDLHPLGRAVNGMAELGKAGRPDLVVATWLAALPQLLQARDLGKALAQLDALLLDHPTPLPPSARAALAQVTTGKAASLAKAMLKR